MRHRGPHILPAYFILTFQSRFVLFVLFSLAKVPVRQTDCENGVELGHEVITVRSILGYSGLSGYLQCRHPI